MSIEQSWPSLLPDALHELGHDIDVINGSVSGDTTGNGLARLPSLLSTHQPDYLLVELGANDGLRGFKPKIIEQNLTKIISMAQQADTKVIAMEIRIPPNYGKRYNDAFNATYDNIGTELNVPILPFFLEQVIVKPEWMMKDGLHPKPEAQPWIAQFMAENLIDYL